MGMSVVSIKVDSIIHEKLKAIALNETRTISQQVAHFLKAAIRDYEEAEGAKNLRDGEAEQRESCEESNMQNSPL